MYIPKDFEHNNRDQLFHFIETYNFSTLLSEHDGDLQVTHVPVMLDREAGQYGTLRWHVAKQNLHSKNLNGSKPALLIFHGPHAYISPAWYKSTPNVPTWNYAVVHAHGIPQPINSNELTHDLGEMVSFHEEKYNKTNHRYEISEDYKLKLLEHIQGFRMEILRLEGKFKLGQNRSMEDQDSMLNQLRNQNSSSAASLVELIETVCFLK